MVRVIGIDPGTLSIDVCGLEDGRLTLDRMLPTADALADPNRFVAWLRSTGEPDLIGGPSGYGLPLVRANEATERDLRLAFLADEGESGGIGGLRRLARVLGTSGLPVVYTPGVIHLPSVPPYRKLNRIDLGTADKVATAALAIQDQQLRLRCPPKATSFILLELGGAFTAGVAVESGRIVDGIGGTGGPMGWLSAGGWDGEVAFLAGTVTKRMLFEGGRLSSPGAQGLSAYVEAAHKAVLALTASHPRPREILLSGRHARDPEVRAELEPRLVAIAPVRDLQGFAKVAKQGAQGAALLADGLAGGEQRALVETLGLREASGTALDYLRVISPEVALRRLGIGDG